MGQLLEISFVVFAVGLWVFRALMAVWAQSRHPILNEVDDFYGEKHDPPSK